jgi:hypothetical protein
MYEEDGSKDRMAHYTKGEIDTLVRFQ